MKSVKFNFFILAAVVSITGCSRDPKKPTLEYIPHMMDQPSVKSQEPGPAGIAGRVPPAGTLSQTSEAPYPYANDAEAAEKNLKNPLPRTKSVLLEGKKAYGTYCMVCHGVRGEGNGSIVPRFPPPPTLHSEKVRNWSDGRIFHVITRGQNLMPSYATQVTTRERWAIVNYVRVLQRALNPTPQDIEELKNKK